MKGKLAKGVGSQYHFTLPRNTVYPALLPLMRTPLLPVVDCTDAPADLNGLIRFAVRRNLVSACVSSRFFWPVPTGVDSVLTRVPSIVHQHLYTLSNQTHNGCKFKNAQSTIVSKVPITGIVCRQKLVQKGRGILN